MSHIPEDELHAYLDQALGRLRCVEIESHLAECTRCRDARDGIAALRDQTTALLARLAPRRTIVPPYAEIRRRAQVELLRQQRILARLAWAASIVLALGIGWTASTLYRSPATGAPLASAPVAAPAPVEAVPVEPAPVVPQPAAALAQPAAAQPEPAARSVPQQGFAAVPAPRHPARTQPVVQGWRTVAWDVAPAAPVKPESVAAEPPVASPTPAGPVVTRQLATGEVIRSVGGLPTDVSSLLHGRPSAEPGIKPVAPAMPPAYSAGNLSLRSGVGAAPSAVPSDSLRAMMRRLNLMLRVR